MPRRLFKTLSRQRHLWKDRWFIRPFRSWMDNSLYWSLNRRSVTRAFALGLFLAFVPLPVHLILSALLAMVLRLNVPVAVAGTLISNPFTMVPMFLFAYWVGCRVLGVTPEVVQFELTWHWLTNGLLPIWKPFLLGCLIMGLTTAVTGYIVLGGLWHLSLVLKYRKRKAVSTPDPSTTPRK
jgi:uncharacterized protein